MAKTNWQMGDTVQPADLNQIGQEINKNTSDIENIQQELEHLDLSAENVTLDSPDFVSKNVKDGMEELFTSVSEGKGKLEMTITDMKGTVSKQGDVATFDELDAGVKSIPQAKGNAARADVLAGKTFSSEVAGIEQTGTMVNRGAVNHNITVEYGEYTIPSGYHNGQGKVRATYPRGKRYASGQLRTPTGGVFTIRDLTFTPRVVIARHATNPSEHWSAATSDTNGMYRTSSGHRNYTPTWYNDGFTIDSGYGNADFYWEAYE